MIFLDTETTGLVGPAILIQWANDTEGSVHLHEVWYEPVRSTIALLEDICDDTVCGFNLSFDWFHINKLYNLLRECKNKSKPPRPEEIASYDQSSLTNYCLKPRGALDLFLYSRKTEWQNLMGRRNIVIRNIPNQVVYKIANILHEKIKFPPIISLG